MERTKQQLGVMIGYRRSEIMKLKKKSCQCLNQVIKLDEEVTKLEKAYEENDF